MLRGAIVVVAAVYAVNFFFLAFLIGPWDFDHLSGYYELAWRFWTTDGGIPHYDPYLCGGRTLGGDPQLPIFSPLVLLVPILGSTVLIKWELFAQLLLGGWALWRWLESLGVDKQGRQWGLFLFLAGGGTVAKFLVGHVTLGFYTLYPLFFYLSDRLAKVKFKDSHPYRAAYLCLFAYAGFYKPNFLIYGVPPIFLEALARAWLLRRPAILYELGLAVAVSGLVDAVTLLPAWKYFSDFPRTDGSAPQLVAPYAFLANILMPLKAIPKAFYGEGFIMRHEYNIFVGPAALVFVWWGMKRAKKSKRRPEWMALVFLFVMSAWIGIGCLSHSLSPFFPYTWFHALWPGFKSARVPTRFWMGAYFALIAFSALGFKAPKKTGWRWAFALLGILPLLLGAVVNLSKTAVEAKRTQWTAERLYPDDILLVDQHPDDQYEHLRQGRAVLNCTDNIEVKRPKDLQPGIMLSPFLAADGLSFDGTEEVRAKWQRWNRFEINAHAAGPFTVTFNMNHHDYWRVEGAGKVVSKPGERLTLASEDTIVRGEVVYEQPYVVEAMVISASTLWGLIGYLLYVFLRKKRKLLR